MTKHKWDSYSAPPTISRGYTLRCLVLVLIIISVYLYGCGKQPTLDVQKIYVGDTPLYIEIADEPHERTRGLQFREGLLENWGMLFMYDSERTLEFWMKNTAIPLDLAYIDADGVIREIHQMNPYETTIYRSKRKVKYALEVNRDWLRRHDVTVGDTVTGIEGLFSDALER